jgi:ribosome biogenesis GTPase A
VKGHEPAAAPGNSKREAEKAAALSFWKDRRGMTAEMKTRSGFVAILGAPNAGKSTC